MQCGNLPLEDALERINSWWQQTPWVPYYLHWDDRASWPDPWQLLDDNIYCPVARALGMLYTITLVDRPDLQDCQMIEVENDNLVLAVQGKYILNWEPDTIVNISLSTKNYRNSVTQQQIKQLIR